MAPVLVTRKWKRDASENVMVLEAAVQSLLRSVLGSELRLADRLLAGEVLHTLHASFFVRQADEADPFWTATRNHRREDIPHR